MALPDLVSISFDSTDEADYLDKNNMFAMSDVELVLGIAKWLQRWE